MEAREKDAWSLVDIDEITDSEYKSEIKSPFGEANKDLTSSTYCGGLIPKKEEWPDKLDPMGDGAYRKRGEPLFINVSQ